MKNLITLSLILFLTSCGFEPLYKKSEAGGACDNFKVNTVEFSLAGQKMQYMIQDKLNQACIDPTKEYVVDVKMALTEEAVAIQKDRQVTRYNVVLDATYKLIDLVTNKDIYTGKTRSIGGYDAVTSDYGTYALKQDTKNKLAEEMAREIAFKISYLIKSKIDDPVKSEDTTGKN